ncbi:DNA helicase [Candidatus Phytoplasma ziziphi]|uniref:DNA helicase n=1 Tax=Ziziphus jujuba witches'-broom phytoplasma TaxID=135727 RepID=A0A660HML2_ZIZJU|nr:DnaB-like helicase C-terminal domain-containing protein [Candidatus Phytoplasma ziziphi]AYJ01109.1 DNA helicase [Candidatus Phytoplasma ziziphi]
MSTVISEQKLLKFLLLNPAEIPNVANQISLTEFSDKKTRYVFELMKTFLTQTKYTTFKDFLKPYLESLKRPLTFQDNLINYLKGLKEIPDASIQPLNILIQDIKDDDMISSFRTPKDVMDDIIKDTIDNPSKNGLLGLDTGFKKLNHDTLGFRKKELIILGARPGVGKTTLMMNLAFNIASKKKKVAIISLEMSTEQLYLRVLSAMTGIAKRKIELGAVNEKENAIIKNASEKMKQLNIASKEEVKNNLEELQNYCLKNKVDIVFIDYLQIIPDMICRKISRKLKKLAQFLNIPIFCLSQLNRESDKGKNRVPRLSDLKDSGTIEQDADMVLILVPKSIDEIETNWEKYKDNITNEPIIDLYMIKNRNGDNNKVYNLLFLKKQQKFVEITEQIKLDPDIF